MRNLQIILDEIKSQPERFLTEFGYLNKHVIVNAYNLSQVEWQKVSETWNDIRRGKHIG